jgi:hypothetical protein
MLRRDDFPGGSNAGGPDMGLLDILNTIQNNIHRETDGARMPPGGGMASDPRARTTPGSAAGEQGRSPMAKSLLALLAVYAKKNMQRSGSAPPKPGGTRSEAARAGRLTSSLAAACNRRPMSREWRATKNSWCARRDRCLVARSGLSAVSMK